MNTHTNTIESLGYKPVSESPTLKRIYGLGTALYGKTVVDRDANLYSKIFFFTVAFIPVLYLGKYLIHSRDGSEIVVGKASLSEVAKLWNAVVVVLVLGFVGFFGFNQYSNSPDTIAKNQLLAGQRDIDNGSYSSGIAQLRLAYRSGTRYSSEAKQKLQHMADEEYVAMLTAVDGAAVLEQFIDMPELFPNLFEAAASFVDEYASRDALAAKKAIVVVLALVENEEKRLAYEQKHYQLLQEIVASNPSNSNYAVEFASLDEVYNQCQRCETILTPHQDQLAKTEGARILGQIYAYNGRHEDAYALLNPYVDVGLEKYHDLENDLENLSNKIWDDMVDFLNSSRAPSSFLNQYNAAGEQEQNRLLNEFYVGRLESSEPYRLLEGDYQESAGVVSVALDLGIVMLNRAITMTDAAQRQHELQSAEQTFLAVKGHAEDSDDYQLYLGQVYYWSGNEEKGKGLFDALISKYDRGAGVLYSLASILRDLGEVGQARSYASEAYENTEEQEEKYNLAMQISLMAEEMDDKIAWLEKADPNNPYTKADLLSMRAAQAVDEDETDMAVSLYEQSIAVYDDIPEDSSSLNNAAIVYMSKYGLTHHESDYQQALDLMDKAIVLAPDDSIVLTNSIDNHLDKAMRDVLSQYFDFTVMNLSPEFELFSLLYDSYEEKQVFIKQLLAHPSIQKSLNYTNKALLLAPKNSDLAAQSMGLYFFLSKYPELEALSSRLENIDFDLSEAVASMQKYRDEEELSEIAEAFAIASEYYEKKIAEIDRQQHANEVALLESLEMETQLNALAYGITLDIDEVVKKSRVQFRAKPSAQTRRHYQSALIFQMTKVLVEGDPDFSQFNQANRKLFGGKTVLALYALQQPSLVQKAKSLPQFSEFEQLVRHDYGSYPYARDVEEWFFLDVFAAPIADDVLNQLKSSNLHVFFANMESKMSANEEANAIRNYLSLKINGDNAAAQQVAALAQENNLMVPAAFFTYQVSAE